MRFSFKIFIILFLANYLISSPLVDSLTLKKIEKLVQKEEGDTEYPFVSQWKPRGKEQQTHFGKWCYQRRYNGVLVKVGYYDTPEQAAREGLVAWKERTRNIVEDPSDV